MEVSALNRWQSIGSDLYKLGTIEKELHLFEKYKTDERIRAYEAKMKEQEKQARHEKLQHLKDGDEREFQYVLEKNDVEKMFVEFVYRALRRIWKGFMIGFGIRAGFQVIGALLRSKGNITKLLSTIPTILTGDASRYGLFVGFVFMIFESVMRAARYTMGVKYPNKTSFIGGVVAGLSLFLIPADSRVTIMMFFLVRALEMMAKGGVSSGIIPNIPHAEILVMMAASAQVTYAGMMHRECVEPSYMHFLDHHSQKSRPQLNAFYSLAHGNVNDKSVDVINEWRKGMGKTPLDVNSHRLMCDVMHPHISDNCEVAMLEFYREAFKRAIPVYLPVYLIPMILFRRKQLLSQPLTTLKDNTLAISRSSLFLASYCTMGMYEICWMRRILGNYWRLGIAASGIVGGACVAIEKPHRRIELTLYVLTQAILAGYRIGAKKGWLPIIKHGEVALFCLSMGVLMHTYITAPYLMRPSYFSLFRFCFGSGGVMEGFPRFQQIRKLSGVEVDAKEGDSSALKHSDSFIVKELVKRTITDSNSPPRTTPTNSHSDRTIIAELQRLSPPHSPPHGKENEAPPTRTNVLNGVGKPSYALKTTKPVMMDGMRGANGKARMEM